MESTTQLEHAEDVEEVTQKRARIEARRKFRIVTSTILACNRFSSPFTSHILLEVEAEKPEQAERQIIAALSRATLDVQSSEDSVDGRITRNRGLYTTCPEAEGKLIPLPNTTHSGSISIPNPGHCTTGPGAEGELMNLPNATTYVSVSVPRRGYFAAGPEGQEEITLPIATKYGTPSMAEQENEGQYKQAEREVMTVPGGTNHFSLSTTNPRSFATDPEAEGKILGTVQDAEKFMEEPDVPNEGLENPAGLISDWQSLENLWKMDENTQDWRSLASELKGLITQNLQDLESGSGREKVHKLVEDAKEITKRIGTARSASEGNKFQNMDAKASTTTLPTIRDAEQYLSDVLDKLHSLVSDLSQNVHGRQKQLANFTSMSRLIQNGRKALQTLGQYTNSISGKLNTLVKDLNFRDRIVEKHFNKCAASISAVVESVLEKQKRNFVSVASVTEWYFGEMSSRQNVTASYPFLPVF